MKKIIFVLLVLCLVSSVFAAEQTVTFKGINTIDNRSAGMGGSHITDTTDYFTLLRNPAGLAFSGRHNLIGMTNITLGGPLEEILNTATSKGIDYMLGDGLIPTATGLISKNALNLGINIGGPIAIGGTYKNGFGWGLFDQIVIGAVAPSTIVKANMELDVDFVMGYGHAFNIGIGKLAIGISSDLYAQAPYLNVRQNLMDLLSGGDIMDQLKTAMALKTSTGCNVNAGVQLQLLGFLDIGAVYDNFLSTTISKNVELNMDELDVNALLPFSSDPVTEVGKGTLNLGVGMKMPKFLGLGLISEWNAYADIKDVFAVLKNDPLQRNPILNMSVGTNMTLLNCISLRAGISDSYLSAGVGLRLLGLHIDASIYGKELGMEPGSTPQLNCALSIGIKH